jgi:GBP family porin
MGPDGVNISYGDLSNTSINLSITRKYAVGYNHNISKQTFLFMNVARDERVLKNNVGYDSLTFDSAAAS